MFFPPGAATGRERFFRRESTTKENWADGQIDGVALLAAVWAAAQACFIRAGIANEVQKAHE